MIPGFPESLYDLFNLLFSHFRRGNQPIFEEPDYSSEDHSEIQDDYEYDLDHFFFDDEKASTTFSTTSSTTTSTTTKECNEYHGCVHVTESAYAKVGSQIIDFLNGIFQ